MGQGKAPAPRTERLGPCIKSPSSAQPPTSFPESIPVHRPARARLLRTLAQPCRHIVFLDSDSDPSESESEFDPEAEFHILFDSSESDWVVVRCDDGSSPGIAVWIS